MTDPRSRMTNDDAREYYYAWQKENARRAGVRHTVHRLGWFAAGLILTVVTIVVLNHVVNG